MKQDQHIIDRLRGSVNKHLEHARYKEDLAGRKILEIAPDEHQGAHNTFINASVETLNIEEGSDIEADICKNIPKVDKYYDAIICFEILEHVSNPFDAVEELHRVLKTGGRLYITTPFMFRIHGPLPDRWRFTVYGLQELLKDFRTVVIDSGKEGVNTRDDLDPLHYKTIAVK